jgi:hypothetical protein
MPAARLQFFAVLCLVAASLPAQQNPRALLDKYCVTCHNQRLKTGGLALDQIDLAHVSQGAEVWEKVIRKLRSGAMPPVGLPRPDQASQTAFVSWLETEVDRAAIANPNPGRALLHRLNRAEYGNAIHDLLALDIDPAALLPPDDSVQGFDNIADVLGTSPVLLERYISAAAKVSATAVGDPDIDPVVQTYRVRPDVSQNEHVEGLPLGTIGGTVVRHNFPLDGEYVFKARLWRNTVDFIRGVEHPQRLEILLDGQRIRLATFGGKADIEALNKNQTAFGAEIAERLQVRVPVKAGPHTVGFDFLQKSSAESDELMKPYLRITLDPVDILGYPQVESVSISGPYKATGPGDTPSRRQIFVCRPATAADELPCAKTILSTLARRAYRQPVSDTELETLLGFYQKGRNKKNFDAGIEMALRRVVASPDFIFRFEHDPPAANPNTVYRISDIELASRLSFFLWSSIPDDELLTVATQGKLKDPAILEKQVRRMLSDRRSEALVTNFAGQWLYLRNLQNIKPDQDVFPDFDDNLRQSFAKETELFFDSIIREDRNILDLMTANYTFVNERLARHYDLPNIYGSQFRRVTLPDESRRGLLGQGSILTVTSYANRTSPVIRGKWILTNILGTPPNPPPPNVPALKEPAEGGKVRSMRERMEEHRADAACAGCHKIMDPLGFALENFDAVGHYRAADEDGDPIDASSTLADGAKVDGVASLRRSLLAHPEIFVGTVTEKLLTYALGRGVDYYDMPAIRQIARGDTRFSSIILGIVKSTPFQLKTVGQTVLPSVVAGKQRNQP